MKGGFNNALLEYYGVPLSAYTLRIFINLDLLREITGSDELPKTYREFVELCEKAQAFGEATGRPIIPIAGSRYNAPFLMQDLFSSQTQQLAREIGPPGTFEQFAPRLSRAYAEGWWSLDSPEIRSGLEIMREVGQKMQPGFMQVSRDDASFYFMQGKALMIASGSWDTSSVTQQVDFPFRAFRIPQPDRTDPEFGEFVLGLTSEAGTNAGLSLGVTNASKHPEVAIDFLLFMAGQPMNQKFTDVSGWIPSVVGVTPAEIATDFMIQPDGFTPGFTLVNAGGPDVLRTINNSFHELVAPDGGVEDFLEIIRPQFAGSLHSDSERMLRNAQSSLQRMDVQLAGVAALADANPTDPTATRRLDMILAAANSQELMLANQRLVTEKLRRKLEETEH
jgi:raffinose/stachyose/melibiose transport system substrate-binding protein